MSASARRSASLLAQVEHFLSLPNQPKPLELIYSTHPTWPFRPQQRQQQTSQRQQIDVGVLDSSFNPPQLAHYALARSKKQPLLNGGEGIENSGGRERDYDSILLIFSIRNADKGRGTKRDASTLNRLEMMKAFAKDLEEQGSQNVAVAIVEEPLMIAKSTLVHQYVQGQEQHREDVQPLVRLHWLVGLDTLERFFQVKYYPSPDYFQRACEQFFDEEQTTFVCARRGLDSQPNRQGGEGEGHGEEEALLQSSQVKPWVDRGSIVIMDLDETVRGVSSTAVRKALTEESHAGREEWMNRLKQMTTGRVADYLIQESVYGSD